MSHDGDACGPGCGWCGRCKSGGHTATRTCAQCHEDFERPLHEPYTVYVICDRCVEENRDRQTALHDAVFSRASREWFAKQSNQEAKA